MATPTPPVPPRSVAMIVNTQDPNISSSGRIPVTVGYADPTVFSTNNMQPVGAIEPVPAQSLPPNQQGWNNNNPGALNGPAQPVQGSQFNVGGRNVGI